MKYLIIFLFSLLASLNMNAQTAAASAASSATIGNFWTSNGNVYESENLRAVHSLSAEETGGRWKGFNFNSIPSDASIVGIEVDVEGYISSTAPETFLTISVFDYNSGSYPQYNKTGTQSTAESTITYGSNSDLWGCSSWTVSEIKSYFEVGLFGMSEAKTEPVWYVDYIEVTVYYTTGVPVNNIANWKGMNTLSKASCSYINRISN